MKRMTKPNLAISFLWAGWLVLVSAGTGAAQSTAFTYQGRLTDAGVPPSGTYDIRFQLYDAQTAGNVICGAQGSPNVSVVNGAFTVQLDFGSEACFPFGSNRYLEVAVRPTGSPNPHTVLSPRQQILSVPYSLKSLKAQDANNATNAQIATNALSLGGFGASLYLRTNGDGSALTNLNAGSIASGTLSDGRISSNIPRLDAVNQTFSGNTFFGGNVGIGTSGPTSKLDVRGNLTLEAGISPVLYTSTADVEQNRYLQLINSPTSPSASGFKAGGLLVADSYGYANPGKNDLIVKGNVGIGTSSPQSPLSVKTGIGYGLTHTDGNVTVGSYVNSIGGWLGTRSDHPLNFFTNDSSPLMTIDTGGNVAIGTTTDFLSKFKVHSSVAGGNGVVAVASGAAIQAINPTGGIAGSFSGRVSIQDGELKIDVLGFSGSQSLCRNSSNEVATCSSSLRYKKDFQPFIDGFGLIRQLSPISFRWKADNALDLGFGAEDVAKINPLFVTYNQKGEIEGVKYDRLSLVFVNAFKEQQAQINEQRSLLEQQQTLIKQQQRQLEALTKIICQEQPQAALCHVGKQ